MEVLMTYYTLAASCLRVPPAAHEQTTAGRRLDLQAAGKALDKSLESSSSVLLVGTWRRMVQLYQDAVAHVTAEGRAPTQDGVMPVMGVKDETYRNCRKLATHVKLQVNTGAPLPCTTAASACLVPG
jgi:hypothetical protein